MSSAGKLGAEADAGDVEEEMAVDIAQIDVAQVAGGDDFRRLLQIRRDRHGSSKVVCGAQRQNAQRQARLGQRGSRSVERAVASADNHQIDGAGFMANDIVDSVLLADPDLTHVDAGSFQLLDGCRDRTGPATGARVDDEQCTPPQWFLSHGGSYIV